MPTIGLSREIRDNWSSLGIKLLKFDKRMSLKYAKDLICLETQMGVVSTKEVLMQCWASGRTIYLTEFSDSVITNGIKANPQLEGFLALLEGRSIYCSGLDEDVKNLTWESSKHPTFSRRRDNGISYNLLMDP